jgi:serine/threonine protein phosphatase PrpC
VQRARLFLNETLDEPAAACFGGGTTSVLSVRCPDKETPNEDAAAIIPFRERSGVLVVADGLGGNAAGEVASRTAIETLSAAINEARHGRMSLRTAIMNGIERANTSIQELGVGAATTLAAIEIDDGSIRTYNVGDSAVLVVGGRGKIKLQTVAHSPVGYGLEAGLIDEDEAMHHKERHIVSNVIGRPEMRIDVGSPIKLAPRDTVLLATDGLFDNLHLEEIADGIRKGKLAESLALLFRNCLARMNKPANGNPSKPDDVTAVMFRLNPKPRKTATIRAARHSYNGRRAQKVAGRR